MGNAQTRAIFLPEIFFSIGVKEHNPSRFAVHDTLLIESASEIVLIVLTKSIVLFILKKIIQIAELVQPRQPTLSLYQQEFASIGNDRYREQYK